MAKKAAKKEEPNKAQIIRDAFAQLGLDAPAKDVRAFAEKKGTTVADAQVSNLRTKLKGGSKTKSKEKPAGKNEHGNAYAVLEAALFLVDAVGVEQAKKIIDRLPTK